MKFAKTIAQALMIVSLMAPLAASAAPYVPHHPRVNEVNARRNWQGSRIQQGIHNGSLSSSELHSLRTEGRQIHTEERDMRSMDGGHLTRADQRVLNQQLNQRSSQIYTDKHN